MSFSSDLWKGFDLLEENFTAKKEELILIYQIFLEISTIENDYSNGLKYIATLPNNSKNDNSLSHAISSFVHSLEMMSTFHKEHSTYISDKILIPLREIIDTQITRVNNLITGNHQNEKEFQKCLNILVKNQETFHASAKEMSIAVTQYEVGKDNENLSKSQKNKLLLAQNKKIEFAKETEKTYINCLKFTNDKREEFNYQTKKILDELEEIHNNLIQTMQLGLRKYADNKTKLEEKISTENKNLENIFDKISATDDTKEFIEANATKTFPFYKFEFVPYKPTEINQIIHQNNPEKKVDNSFMATIKSFITKELKYIPPKVDDATQQKYDEIKDILEDIWKKGMIDDQKKKNLLFLLADKSNINYLVQLLNQYRWHGDFTLSLNSYDIVKEIFLAILNNKNFQTDYEILKHIIILSQTFYKMIPDAKNPNYFIQAGIQDHFIWHNRKTWEEIIKYSLGEQDKSKNDPLVLKGNKVNENDRMKKLKVFAQITLVNYLSNMCWFGVSKSIIKEVKDFFCKIYELNTQEINECINAPPEYDTKEVQGEEEKIEEKLKVKEGGVEGVKKEMEEMEKKEKEKSTNENTTQKEDKAIEPDKTN